MPSSPSRGHGRGHGGSNAHRVYQRRISSNPNLELKVKWCFEIFNSLDNTLTKYMLSSQPWLQKSEVHLENVEEKIEVLVEWITKLRVSRGFPNVINRQDEIAPPHQPIGIIELAAGIVISHMFEEKGSTSLQQGDDHGHNSQLNLGIMARIGSFLADEEQEWFNASQVLCSLLQYLNCHIFQVFFILAYILSLVQL